MRLTVQSGNQPGQAFEIAKDVATIGRGTGCDIVLPDPSASRNHCQIVHDASGLTIQDLGSANGTFVNNERISAPRILRVGDTIRVGHTTFTIEEGEPSTILEISQITPSASANPPLTQAGSPRLLLAIGGVSVIAVLGLLIFNFVVGRASPTPPVALVPTVDTTVPTLSTSQATLTPRPAPTSTAAANTPASAATRTALPNPEATFTATPIPSPTATPTRFYADPRVLLPEPRRKFTLNEQIAFSWIPVGTLRGNDWYRVLVARESNFTEIACEIRTKETFVTLPGEGVSCNARWQFNNRYFWRIHVVAIDTAGDVNVLSPFQGQIYEFAWAP